MNEKEKFFEDFNKGLHRIGKLTMLLAYQLMGKASLVELQRLQLSTFR